jgi:hypothetical protein
LWLHRISKVGKKEKRYKGFNPGTTPGFLCEQRGSGVQRKSGI